MQVTLNYDILEKILWKCNKSFTRNEMIKLKKIKLFNRFLIQERWVNYRLYKIMNKFLGRARHTLLYTSYTSKKLKGYNCYIIVL
jgi:hypothetical protein